MNEQSQKSSVISRASNKFFLTLTGMFLLLFVWMSYAKIDITTHAIGIIIPEENTTQLGTMVTGEIVAVNFKEGDTVKKGDIISYVKILNKPGVKPIEMAKTSEIDSSKYMEFMESTLDQLTSSMDLDFDVMLGKPKQTGLEQFFWN